MTDIKKELNADELAKVAGGARTRYFRHVVMEGDTIESVAKKYYLTEAELMSINGISGPEDFYVGRELRIPEPKC